MALSPDDDRAGRYRVEVDDRWNCPIVPQGGVMAAIATAAMQAELLAMLGRERRDPLTPSSFFGATHHDASEIASRLKR